jgi:predicted NAD/FAD-binding protein
MSLSVRSEASGLEYNATSLATLFCQRRNLFSPRFFGLIRDILRFNREARALLSLADPGPTLGDYLAEHRYGAAFCDEHLVPMSFGAVVRAAARRARVSREVSGAVPREPRDAASERPRALAGGAGGLRDVHRGARRPLERGGAPWLSGDAYRAHERPRRVESVAGSERFDQVVLACHSDQALELLAAPTRAERDILGAIGYQPNRVILHTDASVMPQRPRAWAAWNALIPQEPGKACTVSYWMNLCKASRAPSR